MTNYLTANTIFSGLSGVHRYHFAQVNDVVVMTNGHDDNKCFYTRTGTGGILGMAAPTAAPTSTTGGAGNVLGDVQYRVRWLDDVGGNTISNASASLAVTGLTGSQITVTRPGSPPARATFWIAERTLNSGRVYYPLNRTATTPNGTAIATTTFIDNISDSTLRQRTSISDRKGIPSPFRFCFSNKQRIFMGGGRVYTTTATLTNGSAAVTLGTGFNSYMVGQDLSVPGDTDGVTYKIAVFGSSSTLTLASNYAGTTGSKTILIAGRRDVGCWSEANEPEAFGSATVSPVSNLSNEVQLGDDGQPLSGGVGMGKAGVLWAKETKLFLHPYTIGPGLDGDGAIIELETRRGASGPLALAFVDGFVYGCDQFGIWRMTPGGLPSDISATIANDWRANQIYGVSGDKWHIAWNPNNRTIIFWLTDQTDSYPRLGYVWSTQREAWVNTVRVPVGVTRGIVLPDTDGLLRANCFTTAGAAYNAYSYAYGVGLSFGVHPDNTPTAGTVTSGTATTATITGAAWQTAAEKILDGVEVVKVGAVSGLAERRIITDNTSDTVTVNTNWTNNPAAGDSLIIGAIPAVYRSGRLPLGEPDRKFKSVEVWAWIRYQVSAVDVMCKIYADGSASADTDKSFSINEDGVAVVQGNAIITLDPTVSVQRYQIPLGLWKNDIQIELFSEEAGEPWSLLDLKLIGEVDDSWAPARR